MHRPACPRAAVEAGSLATYAARGLHPGRFLTAWGYVLCGVLIAPLVLLQLGFTVASTISSDFAGYPSNLWWPWSLAGAVIILVAGFYGIRTSARLGTILGITEIASLPRARGVLRGARRVRQQGRGVRHQVHAEGVTGVSGVIAGSVYSVLAFGGFEGAAPLAEEARNPRRRPSRRAVLLATLSIGLLYVFTTYAVDVAFGRPGSPGSAAPVQDRGRAWPGRCTGCSGSSCSSPSSAPADRRERQRRGERGQQEAGFAMGRMVLPARARPGAQPAPLAGDGHRRHVRPDGGGHARPRAGLQPNRRVRHGRHRDRAGACCRVHRGQRGLHRVLRLGVTARAWRRWGRCCTWSSRWRGSPRSFLRG